MRCNNNRTHLNQYFALWSCKRARLEVPFDVSHAGHLKLMIQSLCGSSSEFTWGGQYVHFITFCQKAQWNVCGTLFLCMSPSMEFLITNVTTRPLLMSFVKDNYGLGGMAKASMKSWFVWFGYIAPWPMLLLYPVFDPRCLCPKESGPPLHHWCSARGGIICSSTFALFISVPNWIPVCQAQVRPKVILVLLSPRVLFQMFQDDSGPDNIHHYNGFYFI